MIKKESGEIVITYEFCKWKVDQLSQSLHKLEMTGRAHANPYHVIKGRKQVWESLMQTVCKHEFPIGVEGIQVGDYQCQKCGTYSDDELLDENLQNCFSCNFYDYEPKYPEGEGPGISSCLHEQIIKDNNFLEIYNTTKLCKNWTGDTFKSRPKKTMD